ncbi:hypothetical protein [Spirosoma jeollabukense]
MKTSSCQLAILLALLLALQACRIRITPLPPPVDPPKTEQVCKAPPILTNIKGAWKCGLLLSGNGDPLPESAPFTTATFNRFGTVTFGADKMVIDPDSIFGNRLDNGSPVVYKTYSLETDTVKTGSYYKYGEMFWVRKYYKTRTNDLQNVTSYYLKVISNECNRIHMKGPAGSIEVVLVR